MWHCRVNAVWPKSTARGCTRTLFKNEELLVKVSPSPSPFHSNHPSLRRVSLFSVLIAGRTERRRMAYERARVKEKVAREGVRRWGRLGKGAAGVGSRGCAAIMERGQAEQFESARDCASERGMVGVQPFAEMVGKKKDVRNFHCGPLSASPPLAPV